MPNGDPNWSKKEYPKLKEFFARISSVLIGFANTHNLKVEKYYHQFPSWDFSFKHPSGGLGKIEVRKKDDSLVEIVPCYWMDDFKTGARHLKNLKGEVSEVCSLEHKALRTSLEKMYKILLSWGPDDFESSFTNPYREKISKKQHERDFNRYPTPKTD